MNNDVSLGSFIRHVRQELQAAASELRASGEDALLRVETVNIEVHAVATTSKEGKGGVDLKVLTLGGGKLIKEQEIHKITVTLRAKRPDEPQYFDNLDVAEEIDDDILGDT